MKYSKKPLIFFLAICMVISLFCGSGVPLAQAAGGTPIPIQSEAELVKALSSDASIIELSIEKNLTLDAQIVIPGGKSVKMLGKNGSILQPAGNDAWKQTASLIRVAPGANLTLQQLNINGDDRVRGIYVDAGGSNLTLESVTIQNCNGIAKSGAALFAAATGAGNTGVINIHASRFIGNKVPENTPTSGGAIYIGAGYMANLMENTFKDNRAHSGGAIYIYDSYLFATNCSFDNNFAGQRGGAIHDHGIVVLDHCTVQGNSSDQYGGGLYISASAGDYDGITVLDNTSITNNTGENGGGGVFLASGGALFLRNQSSVTGNQLSSTLMGYKGDRSNVYISP